jgi:hypothetical protein
MTDEIRQATGNDSDIVRSTTFERPWRISRKKLPTRYGRKSLAIVDAKGKVIALIDPSEDEYELALTQHAAEQIVEMSK